MINPEEYWTGDLESDGLYNEATKIHVMVFRKGDDVRVFLNEHLDIPYHGTIDDGIQFIKDNKTAFHNGLAFDLPVIEKVCGVKVEKEFPDFIDTLLMSKFISPEATPPPGCKSSHSIEAYGVRFGIQKPVHEDWSILNRDMVFRCIEDTRIGERVLRELASKFATYSPVAYQQLATEHAFRVACNDFQKYGHPFDKGYAVTLVGWLDESREVFRNRIVKHFPPSIIIKEQVCKDTGFRKWMNPLKRDGTPTTHCTRYMGEDATKVAGPFCRVEFETLDLDSNKKVKEALLKLGWQPKEWNFSKKTGKVTSPKLTEDSYHTIPSGVGQDIASYLQYTHRWRLVSGLLERAEQDVDGNWVVKYDIDTLGTAAHRVTHRVVVNIPSKGFLGKECRSLFKVRPGYRFVTADLDGCHLHLIGCWIKAWDDGEYIKAMLEGDKSKGTDNHSLLAKATGTTRDQAKGIIYSFVNGARAKRLSTLLNIQENEAANILRKLDKNLPSFRKMTDYAVSMLKERGYVETMTGRRLCPHKKNEALSYLLLATEASIQKRATVIMYGWIKQMGVDARLLSMNHDEHSFEVEETQAETVRGWMEEAVKIASQEIGLLPEMGAEAKVGHTWAEH